MHSIKTYPDTPLSLRCQFGHALHQVLWGEEVAPLLAEMQCGWLDGGCRTGAEGIRLWITRSGTMNPAFITLPIIGDDLLAAAHVVVRLESHHSPWWHLDANGVTTEEQLLRYWRQEERLRHPFLREEESSFLDEEGIIWHPAIASRLSERLFDTLGPFSPTFLDDSPVLSLYSAKGEDPNLREFSLNDFYDWADRSWVMAEREEAEAYDQVRKTIQQHASVEEAKAALQRHLDLQSEVQRRIYQIALARKAPLPSYGEALVYKRGS